MINHKYKFIFIHIPRTGGSSIEAQFQYYKDPSDKHWNLFDWKNKLTFEQFNTYFKFSFVRNPWSIVISNYLDKGWYSNKNKGGEIGFHAGKSLKYFLSKYEIAPHEHGDSFFDYLDPEQMDFIGRFENRAEGIKYISDKIGFNICPNIQRRKKPFKTKHYTEYYDEETKQIVAEKYAKDIEYFDYEFGE